MSKKSKQNDRGTFAICITAGLFAGLGVVPVLDNLMLALALGALVGFGAGYFFTHRKKSGKR